MRGANMKNYIALFEENGKDGYGVVFPDFPGCISAGRTYEEAIRMAHEALSLHAEGEKKLPKPRTLGQIKKTWADWEEWEKDGNFVVGYVSLFPFTMKKKRINIVLNEGLLAHIDVVTKNRSEFITKAVEKVLGVGN